MQVSENISETTRINLGLDLVAVAGETKISTKNLQAMEENNFAALPAEAFARGFYYSLCPNPFS